MNTNTMPTDLDLARERIEVAVHDYDFCGDCGMPMIVEAHGARLWVECSTLRSLGRLRLLLASGFHERHAIDVPVEVEAEAAA